MAVIRIQLLPFNTKNLMFLSLIIEVCKILLKSKIQNLFVNKQMQHRKENVFFD